jgi:hypothetical protein
LPGGSKVNAKNLFWLQVVNTTSSNGGEPNNSPYPDIYASPYKGVTATGTYVSPIAGTKALPFYFTPAETTLDPNPYVGKANIRSSSFTLTNSKGTKVKRNNDMAFWDFPTRPATNSWTADLWLAGWDGATKNITVYNGVEWGFNVKPVPEVSTGVAFAVLAGLMMLAMMRKNLADRLA